jgi:hypothetical protein
VVAREADIIGDTQCQDADDDDADLAINDGCFTAGRGNCQDGVDNDGDTFIDLADAGCETPKIALLMRRPLLNIGAGPDADNDGIVDHDEVNLSERRRRHHLTDSRKSRTESAPTTSTRMTTRPARQRHNQQRLLPMASALTVAALTSPSTATATALLMPAITATPPSTQPAQHGRRR